MKTLRLFNGRGLGKYMRGYHGFIAAYSKSDAVRVMEEAFGPGRGYMTEINVYWHHDCWGDTMSGITPVRGCWVAKEPNGKPERIL